MTLSIPSRNSSGVRESFAKLRFHCTQKAHARVSESMPTASDSLAAAVLSFDTHCKTCNDVIVTKQSPGMFGRRATRHARNIYFSAGESERERMLVTCNYTQCIIRRSPRRKRSAISPAKFSRSMENLALFAEEDEGRRGRMFSAKIP